MSVSTGSRIGALEVGEPLGAGGMGEVYRARDTRLGREVAIKVLPPSFALDAERRARFEREARVLASLNHPNIATLYGVEESQAGQVLVMELVEGETLSDRLAAGVHIRLAEVLAIVEQVAAALETAHDHGIIHRDLKPANIAVRRDGTVKVLDFGVAKVATAGDSTMNAATGTSTEGVPGAMGPGTPAYMSPEQACGLPVDKRTDIWAFGCVLYELLTGRRAFGGDRPSEIVAKILERDVDFTTLPAGTPAAIRRLLRRCLQRDLVERLRDIGDARLDIKDGRAEESTVAVPTRHTRKLWIAGLIAVAAVLTATAPRIVRSFTSVSKNSGEPIRMTILLPPGVSVARGPGRGSSVAVSPDGRTLVIAGTDKDGQRLYRRPLDQLDATPMAGTDRGSSPFFSWDGRWIGFLADGRLKRVSVDGGAPIDVAVVPGALSGVSWGPDDRIVYSYGGKSELHAASIGGGSADRVLPGTAASYPDVLPDGRHVLLGSEGQIQIFDWASGRLRRLDVPGSTPRYAGGHLILTRGSTLLAARFDPARLTTSGPLVPILDGVAGDVSPGGGSRHYALSANGTLAYVAAPSTYELVLAQSDGHERILAAGDRAIENPQFSPDGRSVVVARSRGDADSRDLWLHDLQQGTATRLTFDGGRAPVWMPDGATVVYSHLGKNAGIWARRTDGSTEPTRLLPLDAFHWLVGWTPDRRTMAYGVMEGAPASLMALTDGKSHRVIGPGSVWGGRLSDDGRWLAYYSLDSGNFEVYVTPFPDGGTRWLIGEGTDPTWGPDAREVFYRSGTRLIAARVDRTAGFRVVSSRVVIDPFVPPLYDDYDVHPDGKTLVFVRPSGSTQPREVRVVVNGFSELRRLEGGS